MPERPDARARSLSLGALGLSLALLVAGTWGTGILYLLARLGAGSPVRLALVDGIHVYVGLASVVFLLAKVRRVGLRSRVPGVPRLLLWQRWISWSLLILYPAIYLTGLAALLPLPPRWLATAVNLHLLSSGWAAVPTTWHVWHYRARARPYLARWKPGGRAARYWLALGVVSLPLVFVVAAPRDLSPLALAGGGRAQVAAGLGGVYLDRLLPTGDGRLLAGGDGLYLTAGDGTWKRVDLPSGSGPDAERRIELGIRPAAAGATPLPEPAGHSSHAAPAAAGTILALAASQSRSAYYVGTTAGLYYSPWPEGPYLALPFPAEQVRDLAVDPANPYSVWAAAEGGTYLSVDGGHSWAPLTAGLARPSTAWALSYLDGTLYASDTAAVYSWDPALTAWSRSSSQPWVTSLKAGNGHLYAASQVSGAAVFDGRRWAALDFGGDGHAHGGLAPAHLLAVEPTFGRAYPLGGEGSLGGARDAAAFGGRLWLVGESGATRMDADRVAGAGHAWWVLLVVLTIAAGLVAVRMIRRPASAVAVDVRSESPTFQEDPNASSQDPGRGRHGHLPQPRLRRAERQHQQHETDDGADHGDRGGRRQQGRRPADQAQPAPR